LLDLNNDGKIDNNDTYRNPYNAIPRYVFGLNTNFQYQNFDLNIFFQGQAGAYNYDGMQQRSEVQISRMLQFGGPLIVGQNQILMAVSHGRMHGSLVIPPSSFLTPLL
jgi:hypothetical protein